MPGGARSQLRPRAAMLIAAGEQYEAVARQLGVHERTVRRWASEPEFLAEVRGVRSEFIGRAAARLADGMARAADTLLELLGDPDPRVRLSAAREVLTLAVRVRDQQEIEERLAALEAQAAELATLNRDFP